MALLAVAGWMGLMAAGQYGGGDDDRAAWLANYGISLVAAGLRYGRLQHGCSGPWPAAMRRSIASCVRLLNSQAVSISTNHP
ncbi:MAG: hypothetical protein ABJQ29_09575 [Luteolibacter sp.]